MLFQGEHQYGFSESESHFEAIPKNIQDECDIYHKFVPSFLNKQINLNKLLFQALIPECLLRRTNREKENSWDLLGFFNTIRSDKAGITIFIKAKKSIRKHFFHLNLLLSIQQILREMQNSEMCDISFQRLIFTKCKKLAVKNKAHL